MKKLIFLSFFLVFIFFPIYKISAEEISIYDVNVSDFVDGRATVRWSTNVETKAEIYYGKYESSLEHFIGYSVYDRNHESSFSGLEEDEEYYFKIIAIDIFGNKTESFIQNFDTNDMIDTTHPQITSHKVIQTIWDSVMIIWTTNKKTKADMFYGVDEDDLKSKTSVGTYATQHLKIISKLTPNTRYYLKISAKDKNGNVDNVTVNFGTTPKPSLENQNIKITSIEPVNPISSLIFARSVKIKFKTNWVSKSIIYYGTKESNLGKSIKDDNLVTNHEVVIKDLEPNTQYFFKIKVYDTFHSKTKITDVFNLKTKKLETNLKTGDIVKGSSQYVYIIQGNNKAWIENENIFTGLGYRWDMIKEVDDGTLNNYKETINVSNTRKHPDGTLIKYEDSAAVYLIEKKKKRPFYTGEAFERAGYNWSDIISIDKKKWSYGTGEYIY